MCVDATRFDDGSSTGVEGRPEALASAEDTSARRTHRPTFAQVADACPHRAAPLSMGRVGDDGSLRCFYHGWAFGKGGVRTDDPASFDKRGGVRKSACAAKTYAVAEVDGMVYVWRGNVLEADASLLPRKVPDATPTLPVDTVLDYKVGFEYIVENNLDSARGRRPGIPGGPGLDARARCTSSTCTTGRSRPSPRSACGGATRRTC